MKEANVRNNIIKYASKIGWTLFNNPQGKAWVGVYNKKTHCVEYPRAITFGFGAGTSDLIGLRPVKITSEMVGQTIAQFVAVEVKKDKNGSYKETEGQKRFGAWVNSQGGHYVCADKEEDLV